MLVLSEDDIEPPPSGVYRLIDTETGREQEIEIDTAVGDRFRHRVAVFRESIAESCRRFGAPLATLIAERSWEAEPIDLSPLVSSGVVEAG
ncbi:MAG: hypothetical protein AAGI30_03845 [Planctomycetota bacterium]